jgi:hypothetical protein
MYVVGSVKRMEFAKLSILPSHLYAHLLPVDMRVGDFEPPHTEDDIVLRHL